MAIGGHMSNSFDAAGFYAALDSQRHSMGLTWKQVASLTGVAASTLTRMGQGRSPDANGLAALSKWSGLDVRDFYRDQVEAVVEAEPLAQITVLLRADRNLSREGVSALEAMLKSAYEQMRRKDGEA
jgi:transcriptional regulator with XRE-family HTH domain